MGRALIGAGCVLAAGAVVFQLVPWTPPPGLDAAAADALEAGRRLSRLVMLAVGIVLVSAGLFLRRGPEPGPAAEELGYDEESGPPDRVWPWMAAILAAAVALRIPGLDAGLWYDEVVSLVEFVRLPAAELLTTYTTPNNHILFSLAARGSIEAFGESAWALRLPAALAGVASVWATWWLGALVLPRREALCAAAIAAVSYHHVWFSQNARGYTGLLLLTLVATGLFLAGLRSGRRRIWLGYALVLAAAMYTHLSALSVFVAHGLIYLFAVGGDRLGWPVVRWLEPVDGRDGRTPTRLPHHARLWPLLGFGLGLLLTIQLYAILIPQMLPTFAAQAGEQSVNVKVESWTNPLWTVLEAVRGLGLGPATTVGLVFGAAIGGAGVVDVGRRSPLVLALMLLNVPITLAGLVAIQFHVWPRYFFVDLGFGVLLLVHGAFVTGRIVAARLAAPGAPDSDGVRTGFAVVAVIALAAAAPLWSYYHVPKQDFAGARDYVEVARAPGDSVVTVGLASLPFEELYAPRWSPVTSLGGLEEIERRAERTWVVYTFPDHMADAHPDVLRRLESEYELVRSFPGAIGGGTIYVWRTRAAG